jgi:hypothetical protein
MPLIKWEPFVNVTRLVNDDWMAATTTRVYFIGCLALPIALCVLGMTLDPRLFAPVLFVGGIVYLPLAINAWWRIRCATQLDTFRSISALFPLASSLLLGCVFAFRPGVGSAMGNLMVAVVGVIVALIVGYSYVVAIWVIYFVLKKAKLVVNEFPAEESV